MIYLGSNPIGIADIYVPKLITSSSNSTISISSKLELPMQHAKVLFQPAQTGSGNPSSSNVRPIKGYSSISLQMYKKNIYDYQNIVIADQKIRNNSGVETNDTMEAYTKTPIPVKPGSVITISGVPNDNTTKRIYYLDSTQSWISRDDHSYDYSKITATIPSNCYYIQLQLRRTVANWSAIQIEYNSTNTSYESFSGSIITSSLDSTYYGGIFDFVSGTLTVTWANISSYAGETLSGQWISSKDVYVEGTTPTTGAQVAYELSSPQTYQFTPRFIYAPQDTHNILSNCGSVEISYYNY